MTWRCLGSPLMHAETYKIESLFKQNPRSLSAHGRSSSEAHARCNLSHFHTFLCSLSHGHTRLSPFNTPSLCSYSFSGVHCFFFSISISPVCAMCRRLTALNELGAIINDCAYYELEPSQLEPTPQTEPDAPDRTVFNLKKR